MAKLTAAQFADKHIKRTSAALDDMRAGVNAVTIAPGIKAAAKADKMRARLLESLDSGKWADNVKKVPLDEWKKKMIDVGISRVSGGLTANRAKIEAFAADFLPFVESNQNAISTMPDVSIEDSIARMAEWTRRMSKFKRK